MSDRLTRPRPLWLDLGPIADRLRDAAALAVACDFDGTLTQIVRHPDEARLTTRARRALEGIARLPGARLAVLSGRAIEDLAGSLALEGIFLAGQSGLQTRDEAGASEVHVRPGEGIPEGLRDTLREWCGGFPGTRIEDKGLSIAVHYREVAAERQRAFTSGLRGRLGPHRDRIRVVPGKRVFEVMPPGGRSKATALERWLGTDPRGVQVFYLGDDINDEPALAWVRARGGVSVTVARSASRAEYALPAPRDVVWFLEWLAREWSLRAEPAVPLAPVAGRSRS